MTLDQQIAEIDRRISKLWDQSERRDMKMLQLIKKSLEVMKGLKQEIDQLKRKEK